MPNEKKLIARLRDVAEVRVECHEEGIDPLGNACACGEPDCHEAHIQPILDALDRGDTWAWCSVRVVAAYGGFEGDAWLGGCSYRDEADFRTPGGYFDDLRNEAIEALAGTIEESRAATDSLFA